MSLSSNADSHATVTTLEPTTVLVVNARDFDAVVKTMPSVDRKMFVYALVGPPPRSRSAVRLRPGSSCSRQRSLTSTHVAASSSCAGSALNRRGTTWREQGRGMPAIELTEADESKVEEFAGRLFGACLATMELANVELGVRLGLYEALAGAGPVTAAELAERAGIAPLRPGVARAAGGRGRRRGRRHDEAPGRAAVRAPERARARAARRRQRGVHEAVRGGGAVGGEGDRHHGRGVPARARAPRSGCSISTTSRPRSRARCS